MQIAPVRPPFVEFKRVAVQDKPKSEELGRYVTKDVDFAYIMQQGGKDRVEIKATDWLNSIRRKSIDAAPDAYPEEWIKQFENKFEAWKSGMEAPLNGTSVREWPVLSRSQAENFISIGILTIEDVAGMTEDAMRNSGLGARELREKAREWMAGKDIANIAKQQNAELKAENDTLKKMIEDMQNRLSALESQPAQVISTDAPKKRGRKPNVEA